MREIPARRRTLAVGAAAASAATAATLLLGPSGPQSAAVDLTALAAAMPQAVDVPAAASEAQAVAPGSAPTYFLRLDDIPGDSTDRTHPNELQIESFSWGASNSGSASAGGGAGSGKVQFQDLHFTSSVGKASAKLLMHCATGKHIANADFVVRKAGSRPLEYLKIKMADVLVSSYSVSGSAATTEAFTLVFKKVTFTYQPLKPDGSLDTPVTFAYDAAGNNE